MTLSLLVASFSIAAAFPPRDPQVVFNSADLQSGMHPIDPLTDQLDAQVWNASSDFLTSSLLIELVRTSVTSHAIGIYDTTMPASPLFNVLPDTARVGWFAVVYFSGGNLTVTLFDQNAIIHGQNTYPGVNANAFGFYIQGPAGTFYSQDSRNLGSPHALTYGGIGVNFHDWWECFEDSTDPTIEADFDDVILLMQQAIPTVTHRSTWGRVKSLYR
ncbi:MAG TPA: hypothetical protein VJY35_10840 [Candidatus Eisenbacteria bacterium]|nr:hypothetical protein [Candidatus Eisenbacteria bacterium]